MAFKSLLKISISVVAIGGCTSMNYPKSDHFNGSTFVNPNAQVNKSLFDVLKWQLTKESAKWPENVENTAQPQVATTVEERQIVTTFINHATHLIQLKGLNFLTDPVFSKRVSPFPWIGPKRIRKPGIELSNLPKIDVVLISHNHYDHMDSESIQSLSEKFNPLFIVPLGNTEKLKNFGAKNVIELDWWQDTLIPSSDVKVSVVPAQHWSQRGPFDTNKALWGGFVIKSPTVKIFFAGDTGYSNHFAEIHKRFGPMELSILPIGAYEPRWFMKEQHMNPEEAVQAHLDLQSKKTLGTHFGTFRLADEAMEEPALALNRELAAKKISADQFLAPDNGQTHRFDF